MKWLLAGLSLFCAQTFALEAQRVAPGVYVIPGIVGDPSPENRGRVVNTSFIVGRTGVIVIDSGANTHQGQAILATIRRVTRKPVKLLINTHPHPQNVLGNAAFAERGIAILATAVTAEKMNERCPRCLENLTASVGVEGMRDTRIVLPQQTLDTDTTLTAGGRRLRLIPTGWGHSEGDLAVLDSKTGVLFTADLVYAGQIPHFFEARVDGWLAALDTLAALPVRTVVPGRGPIGPPAQIATMRRYVQQLRDTVTTAYRAGRTLDETLTHADFPEFRNWQGYATRHPLNVQHVWYEVERADFTAAP